MVWPQAIDTALFRIGNQSLANPLFDWLMPLFSGQGTKGIVILIALAVTVGLLWKGGARGRLCVLMLALIVWPGDSLVCNTIKHAVARPRPPGIVPDVRLPGKEEQTYARTQAAMGGEVITTQSGVMAISYSSMPSSHAANWFAATMILLIYYRRSWRFMLPMGCAVGFSRIYLGVHYPSDVLAGAILGGGYAAAGVWGLNWLWNWAGPRWFPLWWEKLPSLIAVGGRGSRVEGREQAPLKPGVGTSTLDAHWLRLGYVFVAGMTLLNLLYLASGTITLSKDEAYQWLWSKHLALSYYSKPPGIALIQFAGTGLWGDNVFGVRSFSPVFAAILSWALLRFFAREVGARPAFVLLLILAAAPLLALGSILMTIDPPLVLCWTLAMIVGWRAAKPEGQTRHWVLVGLAMGLAFLCKYSALYQLVCWALFFALWRPARVHLKKPGPYLALLIFAICTLPVIIWNAQHHWVTVSHLATNAAVGTQWHPTLQYFWDFLFVEMGVLNPVFFVGALWAAVAFWRRRQENPLWLYFFSMGVPVFIGHWLYSLHSRILPNWIAPAIVPMFCLMVAYWRGRWREGARAVKGWLIAGLVLGFVASTVMHESKLVGKIAGRPLPPEVDPQRRVRAWKETAAVVAQAREELLREGKPVFIICDHYGLVGELTFHWPEARDALHRQPLVYYQASPRPDNQLFFWPEYHYLGRRTGENAIYVTEPDMNPLTKGWWWDWLTGKRISYATSIPPIASPPLMLEEFQSVTDLGVQDVKLDGWVYRRVQLFACRNLH